MAGHYSMEMQLGRRFLHPCSLCLAKSAGGALAVASCNVAHFVFFIIGRVQCECRESSEAPGV